MSTEFEDLGFDDLDLEDLDLGGNDNTVIVTEVKEEPKVEVKNEPKEEPKDEEVYNATIEEFEKNGQQVSLLGDEPEKENKPKKEDKPKKESKSKATKEESKGKPTKKSVVTGPRIVKVFGEELWVEDDVNVTNDQIKRRIIEDFGYGEFESSNVIFDYNPTTGILDVCKSFNKKG